LIWLSRIVVMDVDESSVAPEPAAPLPTTAQAIRFCRTCGEPWQRDWDSCPACAERARSAQPAVEASRTYERDRKSIFSSVVLYFSLLAVSFVAVLIIAATGRGDSAYVEIGAEVVMSVITVIWCVRERQLILPQLRPAGVRWYLLAPVLAVGTFLFAVTAIEGMHRLFGLEKLGYLDSFRKAHLGWFWIILSVCVQPGVIEELAFRGAILSSLGRALSSREAMFVSALMFGILHLSVPSMPHLFLIGVILAWLRYRSGSLLPGMLMHFTHNLLVIVAEHHGGILPW